MTSPVWALISACHMEPPQGYVARERAASGTRSGPRGLPYLQQAGTRRRRPTPFSLRRRQRGPVPRAGGPPRFRGHGTPRGGVCARVLRGQHPGAAGGPRLHRLLRAARCRLWRQGKPPGDVRPRAVPRPTRPSQPICRGCRWWRRLTRRSPWAWCARWTASPRWWSIARSARRPRGCAQLMGACSTAQATSATTSSREPFSRPSPGVRGRWPSTGRGDWRLT